MKITLSIILLVVLLLCAYFVFLSVTDEVPEARLVNGQLRPCPDTPNCVSSETSGEKYIEPIAATSGTSLDDLWENVIDAIKQQGGQIESQDENYVWATFQSKLFRFTDDVEIRLDDEKGVVQIRSGSRSGKSDLGVNRKRVEAIRAAAK